ncbi:hypothetical protein A2U01_0065133, partial [Trifolium medium]|nr:hypothetical protein [Trifolium medium]
RCIKTSPRGFYVPVQGSHLPLVGVVLHLQMGSRGDGDHVCDGPKGDDEVDISRGLCRRLVESLEIGAHVRCQEGLVELQGLE